ncbi:MAG TPA: mevalonate kinase [Candidatus Aenigmarchaeota archaeon]|nr:MAG: mevalonate kinase [Candidatus Aenigmarchaeota archaeon]HDD46373.1 mevalonate kinase [Candidatus Aenigmarchaeota archaeon]
MSQVVKAKAPGKIILFGEHAVVHGKTGIAAAVSMYSDTEIRPASHGFFFDNLGYKVICDRDDFLEAHETLRKGVSKDEFLSLFKSDRTIVSKYLIMKFLTEHELKLRPMKITIRSELRKGMGGSASINASLILALARFYKVTIALDEISRYAYAGDIICHGGMPSGIDNTTVVYGGFIKFNKRNGTAPISIKTKLPIVIGDTLEPAATAVTVPKVTEMLKKSRRHKALMNEIGSISIEAARCIRRGDLERLGKLMNRNQEILREFSISTPKLERLIDASLRAGALGAKLSGGGGGGIMIALARDNNNRKSIAKAIEKAGGKAYIVELGVKGVA